MSSLIEYLIVVTLLGVALLITRLPWSKFLSVSLPQTIIESQEKIRIFGVWSPLKFVYPLFEAWTSFDIDRTKPIPFRPFRWGPTYPINMGIRPMGWEDWIQLDSDYKKTHTIRTHRTNKQGDLATRTLPGYHAQGLECLLEISSFLSIRYPHYFTVTRAQYVQGKEASYGDSLVGEEAGAVIGIKNLITGEDWDFVKIEQEEGPDWNPMKIAGQDDLAVMVEGSDGQYFFQAGSICTAGFWRLQDKIGRSLEEIHANGVVPQWRTKLKFSMERFFQKLKVDKPVQRNNYFFQIDDQLAWSANTNGPEEIFDQALKGPKPGLLEASLDPSWIAPVPTTTALDIWFRTERQTLRRMPKTGCILFTIRTYFHKVADIANEPGVPGRMASAIRSWPDDVAFYKGSELYTPIILPYLDDLHDKQLKEGVVELNEEGIIELARYPF